MQNPGGNPNQPMYYQPPGTSMGNPNYPQMGDQRQQQMMSMQTGVGQPSGTMPPPMGLGQQPGGLQQQQTGMAAAGMPGTSQMYAPGSMQGSQQQRQFTSGTPGGDGMPGLRPASQQQMYGQNVPQYPPGEPQQPLFQQSLQPQHQQLPLPHQPGMQPRATEQRREEKAVRPLVPPAYSPEILDDLSKYSVYTLSVIGRELVQDLFWRTYSLMSVLPKCVERRVQQQGIGDPEPLLEYCSLLLAKIAEIALRIEKAGSGRRITEDEFITMMADPTTPEKTYEETQREAIFEAQRQKLVKLSTALKNFEWLAAVSDPRLLKKPDYV